MNPHGRSQGSTRPRCPSGRGRAQVRGDGRPQPLALPAGGSLLALERRARPRRSARRARSASASSTSVTATRTTTRPSTTRTTSSTRGTVGARRRSGAARTTASRTPVLPRPHRRRRPAADEGRHGNQHGLAGRVREDVAVPVHRRVRPDSPATTGCGRRWIPDNLIRESERDQPGRVRHGARPRCPGTSPAKPVNAGQISGVKESTSTITLSPTRSATRPPDAGARRGPVQDHRAARRTGRCAVTGTRTSNGWFSGQSASTRRTGSYNGPDDLQVHGQARAASQFPLSPTSASVTMQVGSGNGDTTVGISGRPGLALHPAGTQLSAAIAPADGSTACGRSMTWSAATPRSARSTHRATTGPRRRCPADGKVRITATSDDGTFDAVEIPILARPVVTRPSRTSRTRRAAGATRPRASRPTRDEAAVQADHRP